MNKIPIHSAARIRRVTIMKFAFPRDVKRSRLAGLLWNFRSLLFRNPDQFGQDVSEPRFGLGLSEVEINPPVAFVQLVIGVLRLWLGVENRIARAHLLLRVRDSREDPGCQERKNGGPESSDLAARDQHGFPQNIGIDLIENGIILRNPSTVDDAMDWYAVLAHAVQNYTSVKRGSLDRSKQFVLRRM